MGAKQALFPDNVSVNTDKDYLTFTVEVDKHSVITIDNGLIEYDGNNEAVKEYIENSKNDIEKISEISKLAATLEINSEHPKDNENRTSLSDISIDNDGNISIDYRAIVPDGEGIPMEVTKSIGISKDGYTVTGDLKDFKYNIPDTKIDSYLDLLKDKSEFKEHENIEHSSDSYKFDKSVDSNVISSITSVFKDNGRELHNSGATIGNDIKDFVYIAKGYFNPVRLVAVQVPEVKSDLYVHAVVGIDGKVLIDTSSFEFNSFLSSKDISSEDKRKIEEYKENFSFGDVYEKRGYYDRAIEKSSPLSDINSLISNKKFISMIEETDKWGIKVNSVDKRPDLQFPGYENLGIKEAYLYGNQYKTLQKISNSIDGKFNDIASEENIKGKIANDNEVASIRDVLKTTVYENDPTSKRIREFIINTDNLSSDISEFTSNVEFIRNISVNEDGNTDINIKCKEIGAIVENKMSVLSQADTALSKIDIPDIVTDKYMSVVSDYNDTNPDHPLTIKDGKVYNEYGISNDKSFEPDARTNYDFSKLHYTPENKQDYERVLSDKDNAAGIIDAYIDMYAEVGYSEFSEYIKDGKSNEDIEKDFWEKAIEREINDTDIKEAIMASISDGVSESDLRKAANDLSNLDVTDTNVFEKTRDILNPLLKYDVESNDNITHDKDKTESSNSVDNKTDTHKTDNEKDIFESKKPTKEELWNDFVEARGKYESYVAKLPLGISSARNTFAAVLRLKAVVAGRNAEATTADLRNSNFKDKSGLLVEREDFGTHRKINTLDVISCVYNIFTTNLLETLLFTVIGTIANAIEQKADRLSEDKVELEKKEFSVDGNTFELHLETGKEEKMLSIYLCDDNGKMIPEKVTELKIFEGEKITEAFVEKFIDLNSYKIEHIKDAEFLKNVLKEEKIDISSLDTSDKVYEKVLTEKTEGKLDDISVILKINNVGDKSFELTTKDKDADKHIILPAFLTEKVENHIIDRVEVVEKDNTTSSYEKGTDKYNDWLDIYENNNTDSKDKASGEEKEKDEDNIYASEEEKEIVEILMDKPDDCFIELKVDEYGDIKLVVTKDDNVSEYEVNSDKIMDNINDKNIDAITVHDRISADKDEPDVLTDKIDDLKSGKLDNTAGLEPDIILPDISVSDWKSLESDDEKKEFVKNISFGESPEEILSNAEVVIKDEKDEIIDLIAKAVAVDISDLGLNTEEYNSIISDICDLDIDDEPKLKLLDTVDMVNTHSDGIFFDDKYIIGSDDDRKVFEMDNQTGEWIEKTDIDISPTDKIEEKISEFIDEFKPDDSVDINNLDQDNIDKNEELEVFDLGEVESEQYDSSDVDYVYYNEN